VLSAPCGHVGRVDIAPLILLEVDAGEWSASRPHCFTPGEKLQYPLNRGLMSTRAGLDDYGKEENLLPLPEFKFRNVRPRLVAILSTLSGYTTAAAAAANNNNNNK